MAASNPRRFDLARLVLVIWKVRVPAGADVVFPDRCPLSGERANDLLRISDRAFTPWALFGLLFLFLGRRASFEVPVEREAKARFQRARRMRSLVRWVAAIATTFGVLAWLPSWGYESSAGRMVALLIVVAILAVPSVVVDTVYPLPLSLDVGRRESTFEFLDRGYACDFAARNDARLERG